MANQEKKIQEVKDVEVKETKTVGEKLIDLGKKVIGQKTDENGEVTQLSWWYVYQPKTPKSLRK